MPLLIYRDLQKRALIAVLSNFSMLFFKDKPLAMPSRIRTNEAFPFLKPARCNYVVNNFLHSLPRVLAVCIVLANPVIERLKLRVLCERAICTTNDDVVAVHSLNVINQILYWETGLRPTIGKADFTVNLFPKTVLAQFKCDNIHRVGQPSG